MAENRQELVADLAATLEATAELPVERTASRWLGEAEAVAVDLTRGDPDPETVTRRVEHVRELLENVETTDNSEADERLAEARDLVARILD
jgi:hypothetical protein